MPRQNEPLDDDQLGFFDRLAALTRAPDASFAELRTPYESDDRLPVPATVFNAVLNRPEAVELGRGTSPSEAPRAKEPRGGRDRSR